MKVTSLAGAICLLVSWIGNVAAQVTVEVATATPADYAAILHDMSQSPPATIVGRLDLPDDNGTRPVPAVVIMHGSGGIGEAERTVAGALHAAGIASLIVDSFTGRGLSAMGRDQGRLPMAASVLDAFRALTTLRQRPEIDPAHIGVVGFSRGGVAALFTQHEPLRRAVLGDEPGFYAHVAAYPGCSTTWQSPQPTAAPLLFLLGADDDLTPADKCQDYAARLRAAGGTAATVVYRGVSHNFFSEGERFNPQVQNFSACDLIIRDDGRMSYPRLGLVVGDDWPGFVQQVFADCGRRGYTARGTLAVRTQALADMVTFFSTARR